MTKEISFSKDVFASRHIGISDCDIKQMLDVLGIKSLDSLIDEAIPEHIRYHHSLDIPQALSEQEAFKQLHHMGDKNQRFRSLIGMGYQSAILPPVLMRNVLKNPGWYTAYTPYQAEISQGRLEMLLVFQTMISDLTGLPVANASLLDEATAAAEAMMMCHRISRSTKDMFFVSELCHPQTIAVVKTRVKSLGMTCVVGSLSEMESQLDLLCGVLVQYPTTDGSIEDYRDVVDKIHHAGSLVVVAADLLALTLIPPPSEFDADIVVGSTQRFGMPLGLGGPHAAFLSTKSKFQRQIPGRLVGVSHDALGDPAYRLTLQTREQHIRRDKATSNICTAQALPAILATFYAIYHSPEGLINIANRVHYLTTLLATGLDKLGYKPQSELFFDTIKICLDKAKSDDVISHAKAQQINFRIYDDHAIGIALDEKTTYEEVLILLQLFDSEVNWDEETLAQDAQQQYVPLPKRHSDWCTHPTFNSYHSEHQLMRYITKLQNRDLSLVHSMIPLGSCTMKLNSTSELMPVTWPKFSDLHPYAPKEQWTGYQELFQQLETWLCDITGLPVVSLQPNSGAQGEYAGLLAIRAYQNQIDRNICLIPTSAHGTNPASAAMAGLNVVPVSCDDMGNVSIDDLKAKISVHKDRLSTLMITYPSTHGVFEQSIREICSLIHDNGGQVYLDGANMNAQIGLCRPGDYGVDVCHLNFHKTFCVPHGGGGPGMGPIAVAEHLRHCVPSDPLQQNTEVGAIAATAYASPSFLPVPWSYMAMMGPDGLKDASRIAILNANYMAKCLSEHYPILFSNEKGRVAHEFIIDCRPLRQSTGVTVEDIAKRLMDFGYHAPTISWPVADTMMIEPTESESKMELDRFCQAMIMIRKEISEIENNTMDQTNNLLKNAPHTAKMIASDEWTFPYSRQRAVYPLPWIYDNKFWPSVARIDNAYGDRNVVCSCPSMADYGED